MPRGDRGGTCRGIGSRCVAANCGNTNFHGFSLHTFPRNPAQRKKWTDFVKTKRVWDGPTRFSMLCSAHFTRDCFPFRYLFEKEQMGLTPPGQLNKDAVPTIHAVVTADPATPSIPSGQKLDMLSPAEDILSQSSPPKKLRRCYVKREANRILRTLTCTDEKQISKSDSIKLKQRLNPKEQLGPICNVEISKETYTSIDANLNTLKTDCKAETSSPSPNLILAKRESDQKSDIHSRTDIPTNCTASLLPEIQQSTAVCTPAPQHPMVVHTPVPEHLVQVLHVPITSASFEKSDLKSDIHSRTTIPTNCSRSLLPETQHSTAVGTTASQHSTVIHTPIPEHLVQVLHDHETSASFENSDQKSDLHSRTDIPTHFTTSLLHRSQHSAAIPTPAPQHSMVVHTPVPEHLVQVLQVPETSASLDSQRTDSPDKHDTGDDVTNTGSKFGMTGTVPRGSVNFHAIQGLPVNKPFRMQYFSTSLDTTLESKKYVITELKDIPDTEVAPIKIDVQGEIHEVKTDNLDEKYDQELNFGRLFNWVNISGALNKNKEQPAPVIDQYPESQTESHQVTKIDKPYLTETMEIGESFKVKNKEKELNSVRGEEQDKLSKRCIVKVEKLDLNSLTFRDQKEHDSVNIQEFDDNGISSDLGGENYVEANSSVETNYGCISGKQTGSDILANVPFIEILPITNNGSVTHNVDSQANTETEKVSHDSKARYGTMKDNCDLKASITTKKDSQDSKANNRTAIESVYSQEDSGTLKNIHYSMANNETVKDGCDSNANNGPVMGSVSHHSMVNDRTVMHSVYTQENNGRVKNSHNSNANNRPVMLNSLTQSNYRTLIMINSHNLQGNDGKVMHFVFSQKNNETVKDSHPKASNEKFSSDPDASNGKVKYRYDSKANNRPGLFNVFTQANMKILKKSQFSNSSNSIVMYSGTEEGSCDSNTNSGPVMCNVFTQANIGTLKDSQDSKANDGTVKYRYDSKAKNRSGMFNVFTQANMKILKNGQFSNSSNGIVMYSGTEEGSCDSNTNNGPVMCNVFTQANIGTLKDSQDSKANDGSVKYRYDSKAKNRPGMFNVFTQANMKILKKCQFSNTRNGIVMYSGTEEGSCDSNTNNGPVMCNVFTQANIGTLKDSQDSNANNGTVKYRYDSKANNMPGMFNVFTQANMKVLKNCQFSNAGNGIVMYSGTEEGSCDSNTNSGPVMCNVFTQANIGTLKDSRDSKANNGIVKDNCDSNANSGTVKDSFNSNANNGSDPDSFQTEKKCRKRKKPDIPEETNTEKLNEIFETVTFDDNSDPNILPRSSRLRSKGFKINYAKLIVEGGSSDEDEEDGVKSGDETDNTNDAADHDEDDDDVVSDDNVEDRSENMYDDTGLYEVGEDDMTENSLVEKPESDHKSQNKTSDIDEKRTKRVIGERKGVKRKNKIDLEPDNKDPDFNPDEVKLKRGKHDYEDDGFDTDNGGSSSESSSWYDTDGESEDEKKRERKLKKIKMKRLKQLNRIVVNLDEHEDKYFFDNRVSVRMMDRCIPESEKTIQVMVCAVCKNFNTEDKVQMEKHLEIHLNRDFACNKCDYVGTTCAELRDHRSDTHKVYTAKDLKHVCFICDEKFGTFRHYKVHMSAKHNLPPWLCKVCSTKEKPVLFENRIKYKDHLKENHEHLLHPCASCGLLLLANQKHQCYEQEAEKTTCDICGKLIRSIALAAHKDAFHFKTRRFKCPHCDYAALQRCTLDHHIHAKHEGFHKYKCDQCDFSCVRPTQLVSHKRTHSGHKPYKCDQCPYAAHWNVQLKTHKKLHGTPLGQECEKCHVVVRRGATFRKHMKNEHGTE